MKSETIIQMLLGLLITIMLSLEGWSLLELVNARTDRGVLKTDVKNIKEKVNRLSGRLSMVEK